MDDSGNFGEDGIQDLFVSLDKYVEKGNSESLSPHEKEEADQIIENIKTKVVSIDRRYELRRSKLY